MQRPLIRNDQATPKKEKNTSRPTGHLQRFSHRKRFGEGGIPNSVVSKTAATLRRNRLRTRASPGAK